MGLDAVALLVIVGHVQQLQTEVGPLAPHHLRIQPPHIDHQLLQCQGAARVCTLHREKKNSSNAQSLHGKDKFSL